MDADPVMSFTVVDAADRGRFELLRDGELVGFASYREQGQVFVVPHVETLAEHRGQGFANRLMDGIVGLLRDGGRTIVPICPFAADYFRSHPEHGDLVASG